MVKVKGPQDVGAGAVFVLIGIAGFYFGSDLAMGSAARMGPGYFPMLLSGLITALGLIIAVSGFVVEGPPIEPVQLRPITFIVAAILIFGFLIESVGLAITAILLTLFAAYARPDVRLNETLILGASLALFTVVVFVYLLGQALPAWWGR